MAIIATLRDTEEEFGGSFFQPLPVGDLVDIGSYPQPSPGITGIITNRFPTPGAAFGFLTQDPDEEIVDGHGLGPPYLIINALAPAGDYLEPNLGQIWPRIG